MSQTTAPKTLPGAPFFFLLLLGSILSGCRRERKEWDRLRMMGRGVSFFFLFGASPFVRLHINTLYGDSILLCFQTGNRSQGGWAQEFHPAIRVNSLPNKQRPSTAQHPPPISNLRPCSTSMLARERMFLLCPRVQDSKTEGSHC